jgi:hypothetical protein
MNLLPCILYDQDKDGDTILCVSRFSHSVVQNLIQFNYYNFQYETSHKAMLMVLILISLDESKGLNIINP